MLEPDDGKLSRPVLRGEQERKLPDLLDYEYEDLANNLGGCFIDLMSGDFIINVLEPKSWDESGSPHDVGAPEAFRCTSKLSQHLSFLKDFFRLFASRGGNTQKSMIYWGHGF